MTTGGESRPTESTLLLSIEADDKDPNSDKVNRRINWTVTSMALFGILTTTFLLLRSRKAPTEKLYHTFPSDFVWGTATSSYQIEGSVKEDGRGDTVWDVFSHEPGTTLGNATGDVACDHYHRMQDDVKLMASLNVKAYRFSLAWSRILPTGTGKVNPRGIQFYNRLIDTLLAHDIEPWVTLFHWDLPQSLDEEYGGWLDVRTSQAFAEYARICFEAYGDRVKHWITLNESWTVSVAGWSPCSWTQRQGIDRTLHCWTSLIASPCQGCAHLQARVRSRAEGSDWDLQLRRLSLSAD